jgi:exonuclease III
MWWEVHFRHHMSSSFFVFTGLRSVDCSLVDIGGIVDSHWLNFLFIKCRYKILKIINIFKSIANFISIYAPNIYSEKCNFFKFIKNYIEKLDNLIIGGDFNTSLSNLDRGYQSKHIVDEAY